MKTTRKTTSQWFEQALSEGYEWAGQALENMDTDDTWYCLSDALFSFSWYDSPQGDAYWTKIYNDLNDRGL